MKNNINKYIELIIIFTMTLLFTSLLDLNYDEVWNYGFSYNIATGLIPYKDFNMILTPLYPFLGSLFLIVFGKNILVFHIFNALICTSIFYFIKKQNNRSYYICYMILLSVSIPNYNLFCLLLLYLLMYYEKNNKNDYIIGITLGILFLTKQNIGLALCVPTLFIKDKKKIFKRIIGFLIPNSIFLLYLIVTNTLYNFINYTFLGMESFFKDNFLINPVCILTLISIIYLIYMYIKNHKIENLYMLFFQSIAFPIFNFHHVVIGFIPVLGNMLSNFKFIKKYTQLVFLLYVSLVFTTKVLSILDNKAVFINSTNSFKYRYFDKSIENCIKKIGDYYLNTDGKIYILDDFAYTIKLELGIPINKYDLINNGNLGKNGEQIVISEFEETCKDNKCVFLLNQNNLKGRESIQTSKVILNYINNNYNSENTLCGLTIYKSE